MSFKQYWEDVERRRRSVYRSLCEAERGNGGPKKNKPEIIPDPSKHDHLKGGVNNSSQNQSLIPDEISAPVYAKSYDVLEGNGDHEETMGHYRAVEALGWE